MSSEDYESEHEEKQSFPFQVVFSCPRLLNEDEKTKLEKDRNVVSEFKQKKLELEAQKNWDLFYKRNTTKFFKDRHWTKREFSELFYAGSEELCEADVSIVILEVGCGVGNFIFPLLQEFDKLFFYACDFSKRAVQFVKENELYNPDRCHAFQCDITCDDLTNEIAANSVDAVSMIFVLSAIHPDKMVHALQNIYKVLKPGGCILFRDYGLYDHAMLRFAPGHKLSENFYVRQDGTRAYYFRTDELNGLMKDAGFCCNTCDYVQRETVNKKEGLCVPRIFVQGKFRKTNICQPTSEILDGSSEILDGSQGVSLKTSQNGSTVASLQTNQDEVFVDNKCGDNHHKIDGSISHLNTVKYHAE